MSTKCIRARATLLDHKGRSSSHGAEGSWLAQPKCPVLSLPHPCLSAEPKAAPQLPSPSLPCPGHAGDNLLLKASISNACLSANQQAISWKNSG